MASLRDFIQDEFKMQDSSCSSAYASHPRSQQVVGLSNRFKLSALTTDRAMSAFASRPTPTSSRGVIESLQVCAQKAHIMCDIDANCAHAFKPTHAYAPHSFKLLHRQPPGSASENKVHTRLCSSASAEDCRDSASLSTRNNQCA